jgi:hypothetical protein
MSSPAVTVAGNVVTARMSASGVITSVLLAELFATLGSSVALVALTTTVTEPLAGAVKLTLHTMLSPTAKAGSGDPARQVTMAPAGKPDTTHEAVAALLGPAFRQVAVPVTVEPATGLVGKPLSVATKSASATIPKGRVSTLLAVTSSCVRLPAVVLMLSPPLAGAGKVLVQVIVSPMTNTAGSGSGEQL